MNFLKPGSIERPLQSRRSRAAFAAAAGLPVLLLALETLRVGAAATLAGSTDPPALQRALTLDPSNAALEHRLGMVLFYASARPDAAAGLKHLRRAARLGPSEGGYAEDLALACEAAGDAACATGSMERALSLSPLTPRLRWTAANSFLRAGQSNRAGELFRSLLEIDPSYARATFAVYLHQAGGAQTLGERLLREGRDPRLELALADYLSSRGEDAAAFAAWQLAAPRRAGGGGAPFSYADASPYLERLITSGHEQEAVAVWNALARIGALAGGSRPERGVDAPESTGGVFNGGFENAPLNSGFDWRISLPGPVSINFSTASAHTGCRALRLEFTLGRNDEYQPIRQWVVVVPRHSYKLSAYARSDAITSDSGPRLRVQDPFCRECLDAASSAALGTTPWHEVTLEFTVGPRTELVQVSVWRPRSRSFPSELRGVYWLDDVSLTGLDTPAPQPRVESGAIALSRLPL